jgi:hypothetical protein
MQDRLNIKTRTQKTMDVAKNATPDQIAYTLRRMSEQTRRFGSTYCPAWLFVRLGGLGEHETALGTFRLSMFGRSLAKFKVSAAKH